MDKRVIRRMAFGDTLVVEVPQGGKVTITHVGQRGKSVNIGVDLPEEGTVRPTNLDATQPSDVILP